MAPKTRYSAIAKLIWRTICNTLEIDIQAAFMLLLRTRDEMEGFNMNGTAGDEVIAAAGVTAEGEDDDAL
jgi:hypothetical protein